MYEQVTVGFDFAFDWFFSGTNHSTVKQSESKPKISFETQVKTVYDTMTSL